VKGDFFTFGKGHQERLGHGGTENEYAPRQVEPLARKTVIGAAVATHTQQRGPMKGNSSPLGVEMMGAWANEGKKMSLCHGWLRHWQEIG